MASSKRNDEVVTAAVLLIGDELLSGRTKDKNLGYIADYLTELGIDLCEARVVPDVEGDIVAALNAMRERFTYVFTTGGIGPTHDDITADSVARAFGVGIDYHPEAVAMLQSRFPGRELNEARKRMARIPDGASLIPNAVSAAPGFQIGNVFVMAGVPSIMQAMMDEIGNRLEHGRKMLSRTVRCPVPEGDLGGPLGEIQAQHPDVSIGSYPFYEQGAFGSHIVVRSRDEQALERATAAVEHMAAGLVDAVKTGKPWS